MTPSRVIRVLSTLLVLSSLAACGKGDIRTTCDEPQPYQSVVPGPRIEVPEGLDPLDPYKEMPIPKAESEPRPKGSKCIESPPAVR